MSKPVRISEVVPGIYRSPLPLARELASFAEAGGRAVVDLTQRPRDTIARACERHGLTYVKHPLPYEHGDIDRAADAILAMAPGVLFHCFHGPHAHAWSSRAAPSRPKPEPFRPDM